MAAKLGSETLCWHCKCSTNPAGHYCPWAAEGQPVPGWEADLGRLFIIEGPHQTQREERSYIVRQCPLFEKDCEFSSMQDVIEELAKTFNLSWGSARQHINQRIAKWEALTGRKMPAWVKHRNSDEIDEDDI